MLEYSTEPFFHKIERRQHKKVSISITTCINIHNNMHYQHMFLRGIYVFNQCVSGSVHYTDIINAYTGNVIIFTFHYKREFFIYILLEKEGTLSSKSSKELLLYVEIETHSITKCFSSSIAMPHKNNFFH